MYNKRAVIALGGNAISPGSTGNWIASQFSNTRNCVNSILEVIKMGYNVVITHGNGPQVGIALRRVEVAANEAPTSPLGVLVADTEGSIGYMIEQSMQNALYKDKLKNDVVTILTQVLVEKNDPALTNPTKYIGSFYTEEVAKDLAAKEGWTVKKDSDRGWRRVVGSPEPKDIINKDTIKMLVESGKIVIACGGGGIPVYLDDVLHYEGIDAVIDKDKASACLGSEIGADELFILTAVDKVAINFKKPDQKEFDVMTLAEAKKYLAEGQFPAGSMGPKIESAISFLENGGKRVIITDIDKLAAAIDGKAGTSIVK